jgi:hypothetical protein
MFIYRWGLYTLSINIHADCSDNNDGQEHQF